MFPCSPTCLMCQPELFGDDMFHGSSTATWNSSRRALSFVQMNYRMRGTNMTLSLISITNCLISNSSVGGQGFTMNRYHRINIISICNPLTKTKQPFWHQGDNIILIMLIWHPMIACTDDLLPCRMSSSPWQMFKFRRSPGTFRGVKDRQGFATWV